MGLSRASWILLPHQALWASVRVCGTQTRLLSTPHSRSERRERSKRSTKPKFHDPHSRPHFSRFHKGRTSEYMAFLFKIAGIPLEPRERVKNEQMQQATQAAIAKFKGLNRQSLVDVVLSCSKLGNINIDLTRAIHMEVVRALGVMCREEVGVDTAYLAKMMKESAEVGGGAWTSRVPMVQLLQSANEQIFEYWKNLLSKLFRSIDRLKNELSETNHTGVEQAISEEESIEAMRRRALKYRRAQSGGRVPQEHLAQKQVRARKTMFITSWITGKLVLVLDKVISWLRPEPCLKQGKVTGSKKPTDVHKSRMTEECEAVSLFTNTQLVTLLKALSTARYYDSKLMDSILLHFLARLKISETNMHQVAEVLYSCSRLSHHHHDLVGRVLAILSKKRGWLLVTVPDDACKILWALSVLGLVNEAILEMGSERMRRLGKRGGKFSTMQRRQLAQVNRYCWAQ